MRFSDAFRTNQRHLKRRAAGVFEHDGPEVLAFDEQELDLPGSGSLDQSVEKACRLNNC